MKMIREEILNNLAKVCESYKGTFSEHQYLQAALRWLDENLPKENKENVSHETI